MFVHHYIISKWKTSHCLKRSNRT